MADTGGWMMQNLQAAGIKTTDIDTILLTHMHPDHSAGLSDRNSWTPFFPNAELVFHENELKHWEDDAAMARGTEREKQLFFFRLPESRLHLIKNKCACLPMVTKCSLV